MFLKELCYGHTPGRANTLSGVTVTLPLADAHMNADTGQLEQFLKSVEKRAYRMAQLATSNVDDALDIVQDAMLLLASKYAGRSPEEWAPLFYRIVQNRIKDHYRRQKVRSIFQNWFGNSEEDEEDDPIQSVADEAIHDPVRKISGELEIEKLQQALQQLPLRQQQVFLLRNWEGLDVKQTAEAMAISSGSVKTHYSRAIQALKAMLGEENG